MAESTFRGMIEFLDRIGIYDVVLPFILVFTIVFAILEKTRVLGTETIEGKQYTKKNINAMIAFVIAFFVVGSSRLVDILTEVSANTVILLFLGIFFVLLVGTFYKEGEIEIGSTWNKIFMIIMFVAIILIFLNAIKTEDGESWLEYGWDWMEDNWGEDWLPTIVFILAIILFMVYITKEKKTKEKAKKKD